MDPKKMFESMEGCEYFKNQLTNIPEEEREAYVKRLIDFIVSGFMV